MSMPHTGKLTAEVNGRLYQFNGDQWTTPDATTTALLNEITDNTAKQHFTIDEVATKVLQRAGHADFRILESKPDEWPDDLPEGAVD